MPLINFKVKLRPMWTNHCVLSAAAGADKDNANFHNIGFIRKDTKLYILVVTLLDKKQSKLLSKGFER